MIITGEFTDEQMLLTTTQAAKLLGVGRTRIYQLMKDGDLHAVHIGRSSRISWAECERFVAKLDSATDAAAAPERLWRRMVDDDGNERFVPVEVDEPIATA